MPTYATLFVTASGAAPPTHIDEFQHITVSTLDSHDHEHVFSRNSDGASHEEQHQHMAFISQLFGV